MSDKFGTAFFMGEIMKTNFLSKRILTLVAFLLAALSALLLFTAAPKQVTKADESQSGLILTFEITEANTTVNLGMVIGLTSCNWGDGTVDNSNSHTFIEAGTYIVTASDVTSIGEMSFYNVSYLTGVMIGNGVTSIGGGAFLDCSNLTEVTILATNPPTLSNDVFSNNLTAIYVPAESVDSYIGAEGWSEYETLIQPIQTPSSPANSAKTGSDVAGNGTGVIVLSTFVLIVSAVAIVAVIKLFGSRRH